MHEYVYTVCIYIFSMSQTSPHSLSPVSAGDQDPYLVKPIKDNK